ncbi:MAG: hypothetical protein K2X03_30290 [Bryobacteraceae bacterium]|nr:hypothetical protein [Bryobacteraceae bacterium]
MFRFALGLCAVTLTLAQPNANLNQVQSIYIMPMSGGYHQHLANRLIPLGLFQLVADPNRADAILTDRLGEGLEARLDGYDAASRKRDEPVKGESQTVLAERPVTSTLSGGKGTLFLVDRKSRRLLWSIFEKPKNTTAKELNRSAGRVAGHVKQDWTGKKS